MKKKPVRKQRARKGSARKTSSRRTSSRYKLHFSGIALSILTIISSVLFI